MTGDACDVFHLHPGKVAVLRKRMLPDSSVTALAETFKLLGDTTRVRILDALSQSELCVCDIARLLGLTESAVSHQLRLLRGMRLVRPRRDGRMVFYILDDQHIVGLFAQGLEHVEERIAADPRIRPSLDRPHRSDGSARRRAMREGGRPGPALRRPVPGPPKDEGSGQAHASAPAKRRGA